MGGVRTALYNYLFARKHGGQFLLRIEDTDQTRYVPGAEAYIKESLEWCGLVPDESPWVGGPDGPYRQSDRKHLYKDYAEDLIAKDKAYYAFDTPEELDAMRARLQAAGVAAPAYNAVTREHMKYSLTLSADEVKERLARGDQYVVRLKVPRHAEVRFARAEAGKRSWTMSIAIVDPAGDLLAFHRMDGASPASIQNALGKARTAARFRRATQAYDSLIASGRAGLLNFENMTPLEGGVPIVVDGVVVGGIGVSGGTSAEDAVVAKAGAAAVKP